MPNSCGAKLVVRGELASAPQNIKHVLVYLGPTEATSVPENLLRDVARKGSSAAFVYSYEHLPAPNVKREHKIAHIAI